MTKGIEEITKKLEQGVADVFASDEYKAMLSTMAKFHHYSASNCLLIMMQKPEATLVAGYKAWQTKFKRQVKKGEKGITILSPCPHKKIVEDEEGNEKEIRWMTFRACKVFDISQTDGEELPRITHELTGDVDEYTIIMDKLISASPVPVGFEAIDGAYGYFHNGEKRIAIQEGISQTHTIKTTIHEVAHAILHDKEQGAEKDADRMEREVQAESVAYVVCNYLGIDTSDYSFGYVAGWSKDKDSKTLCANLEAIRKTAATIIEALENGEKLSYVVTEEKKSA